MNKADYIKRGAKFKCEQHDCEDFDIETIVKKNHVGEKFKQNIVVSKCCKHKFSIDYLFLHQGKTLLHSR